MMHTSHTRGFCSIIEKGNNKVTRITNNKVVKIFNSPRADKYSALRLNRVHVPIYNTVLPAALRG